MYFLGSEQREYQTQFARVNYPDLLRMLLGWIIRLLLVVVIVRALWSFLSGFFAGAFKSSRIHPKQSTSLMRDPVCGTYVEPTHAFTIKVGTMVHYFCSESCRQAYRQNS